MYACLFHICIILLIVHVYNFDVQATTILLWILEPDPEKRVSLSLKHSADKSVQYFSIVLCLLIVPWLLFLFYLPFQATASQLLKHDWVTRVFINTNKQLANPTQFSQFNIFRNLFLDMPRMLHRHQLIHFPLKCSPFFWGIFFNMKSLSTSIFKTKSHGIMFDRDFILKMIPKKK